MSEEAACYQRVPAGHPEGLIEAFANIYMDFTKAIYDQMDDPMVYIRQSEYGYPTMEMGVAGGAFCNKCVDSHENGGSWVSFDAETADI